MSMAVEIAAMKDLERAKRKMARLAKATGLAPPWPIDEISDADRESMIGRAVRLEIDVCVPIAELKQNLMTIKNESANALLAIERYATGHEKRYAAHAALSKAKSEVYYRKRSREVRDLRKPQA